MATERRQQVLPDLAGPGAVMRRGNGMVGGRKGQFGIMDLEALALEVEQAARATEIVQEVAVDMQEIGVVADARDDMLVPDLGQHRATGLLQRLPSLQLFSAGLDAPVAFF